MAYKTVQDSTAKTRYNAMKGKEQTPKNAFTIILLPSKK